MKSIFLLEDNIELGSSLVEKFQETNFVCHWFKTLKDAKTHLDVLLSSDLFILDVGLPDGSGFEFAQWLRTNKYNQPLMFLTAMSSAEDRLRGYELGAEEYIPKPFLFKELEIRVRHVLDTHLSTDEYDLGELKIDFKSMSLIWSSGEVLFLQNKDMQILELIIKMSPKVLSRDELLDRVWGEDQFPTERTIDNCIVRLRQNLKDYGKYLRSVRGVGYQWIEVDAAEYNK